MPAQFHRVDLNETPILSPMVRDYLQAHPNVQGLTAWPFTMAAFPEVIEARAEKKVNREVLVAELHRQHEAYYVSYPLLRENVEALNAETTFTVTTGHQLQVAGGPLYYFFKMISTIRLAKEIEQRNPGKKIVPVYWMASEDHDFDEIKTIHLYNRTITWNQEVKGVTGKIPTASMQAFLEELKSVTGLDHDAQELVSFLEECYLKHDTLADATRHFVLHYFGRYGLLVLDADSAPLKKQFAFIMKDELVSQAAFAILHKSDEALSAHYKLQVNARPINLFFLEENVRERIVQAPGGHYEIVNTDLGFRKEFLMDLLDHQPDRFSPNVILRPLYQETILPNLAYIGGPGELSYWMQLRPIFDHYEVFYPTLVPRNHAVFVSAKDYERFTQLGFTTKDLFGDVEELVSRYVQSLGDVNPSFGEQRQQVRHVYFEITNRLAGVDATLQASAQAEMQKALNGIDNLEEKLHAALKRNNESAVNVIRGVHAKIFPAKSFQERYANYIPFQLRMGEEFISTLMEAFEPMSEQAVVIVE